MKETSQAFSWRRLSALFAKVNPPLDSLSCSDGCMHVCVCVCVCCKETQAQTYTQTDGSTRTHRKVSESSMQGLCPRGCQCEGCRWMLGDEGRGRGLTNVPSYFQASMSRWLNNRKEAQGLRLEAGALRETATHEGEKGERGRSKQKLLLSSNINEKTNSAQFKQPKTNSIKVTSRKERTVKLAWYSPTSDPQYYRPKGT